VLLGHLENVNMKTGTFFCYNFVSRGQILVIFGSLVGKEICNRTFLTD